MGERDLYINQVFSLSNVWNNEDVFDKAAVNAVADEGLVVEYMSKGYLCRRE